MYDWEKDLKIKKDYFIYKGEAYSYNNENISIYKNYELINTRTEEKMQIYNSLKDMSNFISEEDLYKIKTIYQVRKNFSNIGTFNTREEAEHFIDIVTTRE